VAQAASADSVATTVAGVARHLRWPRMRVNGIRSVMKNAPDATIDDQAAW